MCVFNKTIYTNATVFTDKIMYCDAPAFQNTHGYSMLGSNGPDADFYNFAITLDGGLETIKSNFKFKYYKQPKVVGVYPFGGPIQAQTPV